jgi:hypothetical protein
MCSAEAAGMAAPAGGTTPKGPAAATRTRRGTDEKAGNELSDLPAAALWAYLCAVLQEALHEHLKIVSTLFAEEIV